MARIAYVQGRYLPIDQASVSVEDRGYQFADAIYEVLKLIDGRLVDADRHLARLDRSLAAMRIARPCTDKALLAIVKETVRRNGLSSALVYMQVSRGTAPRNHPFPKNARPTLVVTVRRINLPTARELAEGCGVILHDDLRWRRCDVKSVGLLPNVLAKQAANEAGCREAWLVDATGEVTEGSSTNAWIVDRDGVLRTHPADHAILGGVTRSVVVELARAAGIQVEERAFDRAELAEAREAFLTSATSLVLPVTSIDGRPVANGMPGETTRRLLAAYAEHCGMILPDGAGTTTAA